LLVARFVQSRRSLYEPLFASLFLSGRRPSRLARPTVLLADSCPGGDDSFFPLECALPHDDKRLHFAILTSGFFFSNSLRSFLVFSYSGGLFLFAPQIRAEPHSLNGGKLQGLFSECVFSPKVKCARNGDFLAQVGEYTFPGKLPDPPLVDPPRGSSAS